MLTHKRVEETHHKQDVLVLLVVYNESQFVKVQSNASLGNVASVSLVQLDLSCS